jgi:NAD(P)-dependent dehydrogenase (short-subunit alcohol dehydrogenase family)
METAASILEDIRAAVPQGRSGLTDDEVRLLTELTRRLVASRPEATEEYKRFEAVRERALSLSAARAAQWLAGRRVLVTGGTGCIGSVLMEQLAALGPARLVSISRGVTEPWRHVPDAQYAAADIRDRSRISEIFADVRPEIVFHVAAQREPARAEVEVHRTVTTNVFGTRNILEAAQESGARHVVCASTGKALRPYSPDIYAASKRAAEWLMTRAATQSGSDIVVSGARFTHVVDNSIVADRLRRWCEADTATDSTPGTGTGVIRLHSAEIDFYVQSALESAQLLLGSGLGSRPGAVRMHAIRDLGWPVNLLDLALGMIVETRSNAPIYISGYESGYEPEAFPGLYDPRTAGEVSPLINAFEALAVVPDGCSEIDAFELSPSSDDTEALAALAALEQACAETTDANVLHVPFEDLSVTLLHNALRDTPKPALSRAIELATTRRPQTTTTPDTTHSLLLDALHYWATA